MFSYAPRAEETRQRTLRCLDIKLEQRQQWKIGSFLPRTALSRNGDDDDDDVHDDDDCAKRTKLKVCKQQQQQSQRLPKQISRTTATL